MSALQRAALRASTYLSVALPLANLSSLRFALYVNVIYIVCFHNKLTFIKLSHLFFFQVRKRKRPSINIQSSAHDSKGTFLFSKNQTKSHFKQLVSGLVFREAMAFLFPISFTVLIHYQST